MPNSKCQRAYDHSAANIGFFHHPEQKAPEDQFFNEADVQHRQNVKYDTADGIVDVKAVPQIHGYDGSQGKKIQIFLPIPHFFEAVIGGLFEKQHDPHQTHRQDRVHKEADAAGISKILDAHRIHQDIDRDQQHTK